MKRNKSPSFKLFPCDLHFCGVFTLPPCPSDGWTLCHVLAAIAPLDHTLRLLRFFLGIAEKWQFALAGAELRRRSAARQNNKEMYEDVILFFYVEVKGMFLMEIIQHDNDGYLVSTTS